MEEIRCFRHGNCSCSIGNCEQTCHVCGKEYQDNEFVTASELLLAHLHLRHDIHIGIWSIDLNKEYFDVIIYPKVREALDSLIRYANDEGEHTASVKLARIMSLSAELLNLVHEYKGVQYE